MKILPRNSSYSVHNKHPEVQVLPKELQVIQTWPNCYQSQGRKAQHIPIYSSLMEFSRFILPRKKNDQIFTMSKKVLRIVEDNNLNSQFHRHKHPIDSILYDRFTPRLLDHSWLEALEARLLLWSGSRYGLKGDSRVL